MITSDSDDKQLTTANVGPSNKLKTDKKLQQEIYETTRIGLGARNELTSDCGGGKAQLHADFNFPPVTTRILTDEKGHSIKIRIASPPPQRQSQLVKLHREHFENVMATAATVAAPAVDYKHRDSLASDCPLISLGTISELCQQQSHDVAIAAERDESAFEPGGCPTDTSKRGQQQQQQVSRGDTSEDEGLNRSTNTMKNTTKTINGRKIKRSHSLSEPTKTTKRVAKDRVDERRANRNHGGGQSTEGRSVGVPIEAFNDSNTSEFDDVPGCDSREDTSIDYQNQTNDSRGACVSTAQRRANDQVMDADVRQANRLNLELALLQNSATQNICLGNGVGSTGKSGLSQRYLMDDNNQQHTTNHNHLPQSGVLHPASEFSNTMAVYQHQQQQQQQQQRRLRQRRQSSLEDYDSGYVQLMGDDSRRSSYLNSLEQSALILGATNDLVTANSTTPSLRVEIRRIPAAQNQDTKPEEARKSLERQASSNRAPASTKASIFYTLGIGSLGRSSESFDDNNAPVLNDADDSDETKMAQAEHKPSDLDVFEISLVEARNVLKIGAGQGWTPASNAANDEQGGRCSPTMSRMHRRRSSLLGALGFGAGGGAVSPSSQRRSSIDGVFVRVFKQTPDDELGQQAAISAQAANQSQAADQQENNNGGGGGCNVSQSSHNSSGGQSPDFIQLPLVKLTSASDKLASQEQQQQQQQQKQQQPANTTINFKQLTNQGYKFTCTRQELPVRVSLYMVSKRGGARYTLGHCILAPEDWQQLDCDQSVLDTQMGGATTTNFWPSNKFVTLGSEIRNRRKAKRSLSSGASSNAFETISESQESSNGNCREDEADDREEQGHHDQDKDDQTVWTLEYRLHQTILEAIKSY